MKSFSQPNGRSRSLDSPFCVGRGLGKQIVEKMGRKNSLKSRFVPIEDPEEIIGAATVPAGINKGMAVGKYRSVYVRTEVKRDREKQEQLASLDSSFGLSFADYELMLPQENRAGNETTHGGAGACFYYDHFVSGFQLPYCEEYGVFPMQWTPNSWRMITGFESICRQVNMLPSMNVFSKLVSTKKTGDWVSLCYGSSSTGFVTTLEKEKEGWKSRFFVLRRTAGRDWGSAPGG